MAAPSLLVTPYRAAMAARLSRRRHLIWVTLTGSRSINWMEWEYKTAGFQLHRGT